MDLWAGYFGTPEAVSRNYIQIGMLRIVFQAPAEEPDYGAQLILRVQAGDTASFGLLLEKYGPLVVRFLERKVQNRALAEELAQEVFLRVFRSRRCYQPTARFNKWIFQTFLPA
jgi:hypothetical protein